MSFIPKSFKNAIVSIGIVNQGQTIWIGTGFFVGKKVGENEFEVYLVSNKHVLNKANDYKIRMIDKDTGLVKEYDLPLHKNRSNYLLSNDDLVDIGIVRMNGSFISEHIIDFGLIDIDNNSLSSKEFVDQGGSSGDAIYMLGYPLGLVDIESNEPICRIGCVARMSKTEIERNKKFLLDLQNFPGNSGSPIFLKPEAFAIEGSKPVRRCCLIGIINSYIPYEEQLVSSQTNRIVEIRSENSGIALANPVEFIRALIDDFRAGKR